MEVNEHVKYTIFPTKWGFFGLAGTEKGLFRSCLSVSSRGRAEKLLLAGVETAVPDERHFSSLQREITAYYERRYVDFTDFEPDFGGLSEFSRKILTACREILYGQTVSYAGLAELAACPKAARAAANVLAKNPMPLIIPCHRVIGADAKIGGFSAPGGVRTKQKMLNLETKNRLSVLHAGRRLVSRRNREL